MSRPARLLLPVAAAVMAIGGCGAHTARGRTTPASRLAPVPTPGPSVTTSTTMPLPGPPWLPPPAAVTVAKRYVTAALSYNWAQSPEAWITPVAAICTTQWATALHHDADGGHGGWAAIVTGRDTAVARVLAVYPSAGPGPGRRLEVTATVTLNRIGGTTVTATAMAVDLLAEADGSWLIGWAG